MLTIRLPWPSRDLFPNRHPHWAVLRGLRQIAKGVAYSLTHNEMDGKAINFGGADVPLEYEWCYPDNRKRDQDGLIGACKAYQDGIADALGIDDVHFRLVTPRRGENVNGGAVIVRIGEPCGT